MDNDTTYEFYSLLDASFDITSQGLNALATLSQTLKDNEPGSIVSDALRAPVYTTPVLTLHRREFNEAVEGFFSSGYRNEET